MHQHLEMMKFLLLKTSHQLKLDLHQMKERLGDEYVLLLRPHIIISNKIIIDKSRRLYL